MRRTAPGLGWALTLLLVASPVRPAANEVGRLAALAPDLDPEVLRRAFNAIACSLDREVAAARIVGVIDYSLPSSQPRLWIFDRESSRLLVHALVAHGSGSGEASATRFSNRHGSRQSSLGLFRASESYQGRNGYSLRLDGLDPGVNDQARPRAIVLHGAWYVSREFLGRHGRLGRSWGCPAVELELAREVIDALRDGGALYISASDPEWLGLEARRHCPGAPAAPARAAATDR